MENKYYTPDLSEFHFDFEYELKVDLEWERAICRTSTFDILYKEGVDITRVKYLDVADIESMGFKCNGDDLRFCGTRGEITVQQCTYSYCTRGLGVWITKGDAITLFSGEIKNKSELKKVLKQIGYEK